MAAAEIESDGTVVATFRVPHYDGVEEACVVGEFNDWSPTANPMDRDGDHFVARVALSPGRAYRFRYLLDGERWENDWSADAYVPNGFGEDDSVIDLTEAAVASGSEEGESKTNPPRRRKRNARTTA
jgi:1,4-alpha-glucan branching enzyme